MAKPWEKYAVPAAASAASRPKPWEKYSGAPKPASTEPSALDYVNAAAPTLDQGMLDLGKLVTVDTADTAGRLLRSAVRDDQTLTTKPGGTFETPTGRPSVLDAAPSSTASVPIERGELNPLARAYEATELPQPVPLKDTAFYNEHVAPAISTSMQWLEQQKPETIRKAAQRFSTMASSADKKGPLAQVQTVLGAAKDEPGAVALIALQSAPSMFGPVAAADSVGAIAARRVAATAEAARMNPAMVKALSTAAADAAVKRYGSVVAASVAGMQSGQQTADQFADAVDAISDDQLANLSPVIAHRIMAGEPMEQIRADLKSHGRDTVLAVAGTLTTLSGLVSGASEFEAGLVRTAAPASASTALRKAGLILGEIGKGYGKEAAQETFESGGEQFAQNKALQQVNPQQSLAEGVVSQGVTGGLAGGPSGAVGGGIQGVRHLLAGTTDGALPPTADAPRGTSPDDQEADINLAFEQPPATPHDGTGTAPLAPGSSGVPSAEPAGGLRDPARQPAAGEPVQAGGADAAGIAPGVAAAVPVGVAGGEPGSALSQPRRFEAKSGSGEVSYKHRPDGLLERTITYDGEEPLRQMLYEDEAGDQLFYQYGTSTGKATPLQFSAKMAAEFADEDAVAMGAKPVKAKPEPADALTFKTAKGSTQALQDWAETERRDYEAQGAAGIDPYDLSGLAAADHEAVGPSLVEEALVAKAITLDEAAVERLATQHEDDDAAFMAGIKEMVSGRQTAGQGAGSAVAAPGQGVPRAAAGEDAAGPFGGQQPRGEVESQLGSQVDEPVIRSGDAGNGASIPAAFDPSTAQPTRPAGSSDVRGSAARTRARVPGDAQRPSETSPLDESRGTDAGVSDTAAGAPAEPQAAPSGGQPASPGAVADQGSASLLERIATAADSGDRRAVEQLVQAATHEELQQIAGLDPAGVELLNSEGPESFRRRFLDTIAQEMPEPNPEDTTKGAAPPLPKDGDSPSAASPAGDVSPAGGPSSASDQREKKDTLADPDADAIVATALKLTGGEINKRVRLADLRPQLPGIPRDRLDAKLKAMERGGAAALYQIIDPRERYATDDAAAVNISGIPHHIVILTGKPHGMTEAAPNVPEKKDTPPLRIESLDSKTIIVRGDTKPNKDRIKAIKGAWWNKAAQGWTFKKAHEPAVREALKDLLETKHSDERPAKVEPTSVGTSVNPEQSEEAAIAAMQQRLVDGDGFKTIVQARKLFEEHAGRKAEGLDQKRADELMEQAVVRAARQIVQAGGTPEAIYTQLVALYAKQPVLGTRTSTSIENQAYSTPAPLAYLASKLAGVTRRSWVTEPTAGNGMLLIDTDPKKAIVNELDPQRAAALRAQGYTVTELDAAQADFSPKSADVVLANPPFGTVKEASGNIRSFPGLMPLPTTQIDHAIALRALKAMADDGRAVLLLGGVNATDEAKRSDAYNGSQKRIFYHALYSQYRVVDHFTVDGDLYRRQGAAWPVDVIVIDGRGKSERKLPAADVPKVYTSWDALREKLDARLESRQPDAAADRRRGVDGAQPDAGLDRVPEPAVRPAADAAGTAAEPAGSRVRAGEPAGSRQPVERAAAEPAGRRGGAGAEQPAAEQPARRPADAAVAESGAAAGEPTRPRDPGTGPAGPGRESAELARRLEHAAVEPEGPQVPYEPASQAGVKLGTLVPTNMRTAVRESLSSLEAAKGGLDEYVAHALGYDARTLGKYFSAEQVDALALAFAAMEKGSGLVLGDATGIGKGRVVAGVIRWALKHGHTPIFVTEKPNLYADMYRDLTDIGVEEIRPLMTNAGESVPLDDEGKLTLKTASNHNALLAKLAEDGSLGEHNMIFTTYSQMQTLKGASTPRMRFIEAFASNAIVIMDESHNAGGNDVGRLKQDADPAKGGRAAFARALAGMAKGVLYSSATYAKRPSVMDLYAKTDMVLAVDGNASKLPAAVQAGGVPLQQVVAAMLTRAGQYIRRERSFEGVEYGLHGVPVDRQAAEQLSAIMLSVKHFDDAKATAVERLKQAAKAEGRLVTGDNSTGAAGATSTIFTSLMHNVIDQMLLALKADAAAERAIEALGRGEKPVITVANTMGSFIGDYVEGAQLVSGDRITLSFKDLLRRYLERSRDVLIKDVDGKSTRRRLTDEELGVAGRSAYAHTRKLIDRVQLAENIPVSPIDWIHHRLRQAGYSSGEITGRTETIEYRDGDAVYRTRPGKDVSIAGRRRAITAFNSGTMDVLVLNQAGSTGLSLHASEKFKDQRRRRMIIAQAEKNIDTHMQILGRVHRTGQVVTPVYDQMVADIPAEKRPAAVLAKKMASLSANTTASRDSQFSSKDVVDFLNDYGDAVVAQLMADMPDVHHQLGEPLDRDDTGYVKAEAARKTTGRIPMLPVTQQEQLYELIEGLYKETVARADALGENLLEAKTLDLDARSMGRTVLHPAKDAKSPFADGAYAETMDVKRLGKPYTSEQVRQMAAETLGASADAGLPELARQGAQHMNTVRADTQRDFRAYADAERTRMEAAGTDTAAFEGRMGALDGQFDGWDRFVRLLRPGGQYRLLLPDGAAVYAIVTAIHKKKGVKLPVALGAWSAHFALADGSRAIALPFSQLTTGTEEGKVSVQASATDTMGTPVLKLFDEGQSIRREKRVIVTGNLLAGFSKIRGGQVVNFTMAGGALHQGVLMPRSFNIETYKAEQPVLMAPDKVAGFLARAPSAIPQSSDGTVRITRDGAGYRLMLPPGKSEGGRYYLDQGLRAITGDFVSRGDKMAATVDSAKLTQALDYIAKKFGVTWQTTTHKAEAKTAGGYEVADLDASTPVLSASMHPDAASKTPLTAAVVHAILEQHFGRLGIANLTKRGILKIVATVDDLPYLVQAWVRAQEAKAPGSFVNAVTDHTNGVAYIIASRQRASALPGVLLHEIGEHYGLKRLLGAEHYQEMQDRVRQLHDAGDSPLVNAAWADVQKRYRLKEGSADFIAEVVAHLSGQQDFYHAPLWKKLASWVRTFLFKLGFAKALRDQDIGLLVAAALRREMQGGAGKAQTAALGQPHAAAMGDKGDHSAPMGAPADARTLPAAAEETGDEDEEGVTSIKNAETARQRELRGFPEAEQAAARSFGLVWEEARPHNASDWRAIDDLIAELKRKSRPVTDTEDAQLLYRQIQLQKEHDTLTDQLANLHETGDQADMEPLLFKKQRLDDDLLALYDIAKAIGTANARGLNARKILAKQDYSLARMRLKARAEVMGRPLTPEEEGQIEQLNKRIRELEKQLAAREEAQESEAQSKRQHAEVVKDAEAGGEVTEEKKQAGRKRNKDIAKLLKEAIEAGESIADYATLVQQLARSLVANGVRDRDVLIDGVLNGLLGLGASVSRREVMDAISGYGIFTPLSKEEVDVELRRMKGEMQQVGKIEDMEAGRAPLKTGVERREPSDEERDLIKIVNDMKKRLGIQASDPAKQLKSALDAIKTRLKNQIRDYERALDKRERLIRQKSIPPTDAETTHLKAERDRLKEQYDTIFPADRTLTDEQRLKIAEAALERSIENYERRIEKGELFVKKTPSAAGHPKLQAMRARRDALKQELEELRDADPAHQEAQAVQGLLSSIEEYQRRIAENDFAAKDKKTPFSSPVTEQLRAMRDELRQTVADLRQNSGQLDAQKIAAALKSTQASIDEYARKIADGDVSAQAKAAGPTTPELEALKKQRDALAKVHRAMQRAAKPKKSPEERALKSLSTRLKNETAKLQERIANRDFSEKPKRAPLDSPELRQLRYELDKAKRTFHELLMKWRIANWTPSQKLWHGVKEFAGLPRALMTMADLSAVLRQGAFIAYGHPIRAAQAFWETKGAIWSDAEMHRFNEEIMRRPNATSGLYKRAGLYLADQSATLSQREETYMSRWVEKIPVIKSVYKASERAYVTFLNRLRADAFDALAASLAITGNLTEKEAKGLGNYINNATGRGSVFGQDHGGEIAAQIFFSPRYLTSRFNLLTLQPLRNAGSRRVGKAVATEYARFGLGLLVLYVLAGIAGADDDQDEKDPRSARFGKIRFGDVVIDPLAGLSQIAVLAAREISGEKITWNGKTRPLRGNVRYGQDDGTDVLVQFLRSKLAPVPGAAWDLMKGSDFKGEPLTPLTMAKNTLIPMSLTNIREIYGATGVPQATALSALSLLGMGVSVDE